MLLLRAGGECCNLPPLATAPRPACRYAETYLGFDLRTDDTYMNSPERALLTSTSLARVYPFSCKNGGCGFTFTSLDQPFKVRP